MLTVQERKSLYVKLFFENSDYFLAIRKSYETIFEKHISRHDIGKLLFANDVKNNKRFYRQRVRHIGYAILFIVPEILSTQEIVSPIALILSLVSPDSAGYYKIIEAVHEIDKEFLYGNMTVRQPREEERDRDAENRKEQKRRLADYLRDSGMWDDLEKLQERI